MSILINHPSPVNILIQLTDGDAVYDTVNIHIGDLGKLNEAAQRETDGELWWEPVTQIPNTKETQAVTAVLQQLATGKSLEECNPNDLWYLHGWLEDASEAADSLFRQVEEVLRRVKFMPSGQFYDGNSVLYGV
jgi:hypothetical protein